ncbi:hypothetical protein JMJ35_009826 [Cladonia borealis]|uniref:MFS transporter n=1 Tax=Cladonia borealis TaxID=184061 RepID=A0AA39QRP8_9LECA|nr:hypothetical protein JMJ35_009826 [Cladonia borealis]
MVVVAAAEGNGDPSNDQMPPYSVFNRAQKRIITWQTSSSAFFSGLSSFIYYPTIIALSESLHVSVAAINLTVAAYLIVAGIAPSVFGDISDQKGRRPVSLIALTLYFAANIGLATQNSYAALRQDTRSSPAVTSSRTRAFLNGVPNPFTCLSTMFQKGTSILIVAGAITYTIYSVLGTSISTEMAELYGLNPLLSGLLYLPSGIGGLIASLQTGKLLDYQYKVVARSLEASPPPSVSSDLSPTTLPTHAPPVSVSRSQPNDLYAFLIERARLRARLRAMAPFLLISSFSTLGYGWSLHYKTHIVVPLLMQLLSGSTQVAIFVIIGTLLTDFNPGRSSTAQAAYSIVRCGLAAGGVAALRPLVESVGVGWCFTIATGASVLCAPLLVGLWIWGWGWRRERQERNEERVLG